ncbi:MAG: co-chaperone GroES [Phycisphaerales bacterium]|nr:co-chaperone GroES [Phycisphaerales bacterium]
MAVKPLEDRVLVKPVEKESVTSSGLYLPESSKEKPIHGTVVAVGPGKRLDNGNLASMSVTVVYASYAGTEVEVNGESHLVMRESDLLGIMN